MELTKSCRCCLTRSPDYNLRKPYTEHLNTEIYADMLKECFKLHVLLDTDDSYQGICTICVVRLRDALNFKHQVLTCLKQLLKKNVGADMDNRGDDVTNVDNNLFKSEDEHGDVEWLELFSDDETEDSITYPYKIEVDQEIEESLKVESVSDDLHEEAVKEEFPDHDADDLDFYFCDVKENLPELESLTDNPQKLTGVNEIIVKRIPTNKKNGKKKSSEDKTKGAKKQKTKRVFFNKPSEVLKYKENLQNVLKYSNCTPFYNRTIAGIACMYCREIYKNIDLLRIHISDKHDRGEIKAKRLEVYSLSVKLDITDLKCTICNVNVNFIADLKKHLVEKHNIKFYSVKDHFLDFKLTDTERLNCALCHSTFETYKMLLQHMNKHYRNYICEICDHGFINRQQFKFHKRLQHDLGDFKCSSCDKVFSTKIRRRFHEKYSHNNGPRYVTNCSQCDKTFTSYYQRNKHMTNEHNVSAATYKCNICDKSFIMKSHLTGHIKKVHLMERNHICSHCGSGFFRRRTLLEHMTKHSGERLFKCAICLKSYLRKKTLREHMRIHNNDRKFKCDLCSMAFVQKCSLKGHMLSNHSIIWSDVKNQISKPAN